MKIRTQFVSNSSSTSFVVVMSSPRWDHMVQTLKISPQLLTLLDKHKWTRFQPFGTQHTSVMVLHGVTGERLADFIQYEVEDEDLADELREFTQQVRTYCKERDTTDPLVFSQEDF